MRILKSFFMAVVLAGSLNVSLAQTASGSKAGMQTPKEFRFQQSKTEDVRYLLFLPKGYATNVDKRWPLMLFLHGAGERGNDIMKVTVHGPPKKVSQNPD